VEGPRYVAIPVLQPLSKGLPLKGPVLPQVLKNALTYPLALTDGFNFVPVRAVLATIDLVYVVKGAKLVFLSRFAPLTMFAVSQPAGTDTAESCSDRIP